MSRVVGEIFTAAEYPCTRLYLAGDFDSAEKVATFVIPSHSRPAERVYVIKLDCRSTAIICPCEHCQYRMKTKAGRLESGTYLEHLVDDLIRKGKLDWKHRVEVSVLRHPNRMCWHCRAVRRWLQRHGVFEHLKTVESLLIAKLEDRATS